MDPLMRPDVGLALAVPVLRIGVPNRNGRTYTPEAVSSAISSLPPLMTGKVGMEYPGNDAYNDCREVTHTCSNYRVEGDELLTDVSFRDTIEGRMLESSFRSGIHVFRTAGFASNITAEGMVQGFRLVSINAVLSHNAS